MVGSARRLAIIGSTGSIGRQTLEVVRALPGRFRVAALAAGNNVELLAQQVSEFKPDYFSCSREDVSFDGCERLSTEAIASLPEVDIAVIAASGSAGLLPTLAAVRAGKKVALANKESLVAAGEIITAGAKQSGAEILPVDSEHSAIWQCLNGEETPARRIILTASGGPFRGYNQEQLAAVTVTQALAHPSWRMGPKVTIDSATLMNKGLEVIEARWLFDMPVEDITVVVHPQSIIHSMVEFADGSVKAQLSYPDMRLPIQYALSCPERYDNPTLPRLDWAEISELAFEPPDLEGFPCLRLGIEAGKQGGTYPAALAAADEVAVELFLDGHTGFADIPRIVAGVLDGHDNTTRPSLEDILAADEQSREWARRLAGGGG